MKDFIIENLETILLCCGISIDKYNRLPSRKQAKIFGYIYNQAIHKLDIDCSRIRSIVVFE